MTQMSGHNFVPRENYITIRVFSDPPHTQVGIQRRCGSAASMQKCIRGGVWGVRGDPSSNIPAWGGRRALPDTACGPCRSFCEACLSRFRSKTNPGVGFSPV